MRNGRMGIAEVLLWAVGAALLALYFGARAHGDLEAKRGVAEFEQARQEYAAAVPDAAPGAPEAVPGAAPPAPEPDQTEWAEYRVRLYQRDQAAGAQTPVAVLRIPGAGLEAPVYGDYSERNLNRGVALIDGTAPLGVPGNAGIAGHRDSFFRGLQHVAVGDVIEVAGLAGTRSYRITELAVVDPTDVSVLASTDNEVITLVTCYPFYFAGHAPQRYIVRAEAT